jgi:hypothetical protein
VPKTFSCAFTPPSSYQCVSGPGNYQNLSACTAVCRAPPTPKPTPKPTPPPLPACTGSSSNLTQTECTAWQQLFEAAKGADWIKCNANRLDPCSCGGPSCNLSAYNVLCVLCAEASITAVSLVSNRLQGSIASSISSLDKLNFLNLGGNNLEGSIPTELGLLKHMAYLQLGSNNLEGSIPTELGLLHDLTDLYLQANKLTGPSRSTGSASWTPLLVPTDARSLIVIISNVLFLREATSAFIMVVLVYTASSETRARCIQSRHCRAHTVHKGCGPVEPPPESSAASGPVRREEGNAQTHKLIPVLVCLFACLFISSESCFGAAHPRCLYCLASPRSQEPHAPLECHTPHEPRAPAPPPARAPSPGFSRVASRGRQGAPKGRGRGGSDDAPTYLPACLPACLFFEFFWSLLV